MPPALAALAACGTGSHAPSGGGGRPTGPAKPSPATDRSATEKVVNWANWTLYLDYDEETKKYPTLEAFQKKSGLKATYAEDIDDNDTYYGKIQGQLKNGQDIGKDVIVLHRLDGRPDASGRATLQELDQATLPNAKYLLPKLKDADYDPGRKYSLPWQGDLRGDRLEQGEGARRPEDRLRPVEARAQGPGRGAVARCATRSG